MAEQIDIAGKLAALAERAKFTLSGYSMGFYGELTRERQAKEFMRAVEKEIGEIVTAFDHAALTYEERCGCTTCDCERGHNGLGMAPARAALSTPVPEEGLPRGSASAAEQTIAALRAALRPFARAILPDQTTLSGWRVEHEPTNDDFLHARAVYHGTDSIAPQTAEGDALKAALESLLKEDERLWSAVRAMFNNWRFRDFSKPQQPEPLYVRIFAGILEDRARALSAEAERAEDVEVIRELRGEIETLRAEVRQGDAALAAAEARADRAEEDVLDRLYAKAVRIGAADAEVFLIREGAAFPADRLRARTILKETAHDER